MCCKCYHIIFSTFCLKFKCKIGVQKEVIHNSKNHILITWPATNLLILRKWYGFEKPNHYYFVTIWPTNCFSKAKTYNFHFHKMTSHDLLLQMAYLSFFLGRGLCLLQGDTVFRFFIWMTIQMYFKHLQYSLLYNFPLFVALL